MANESKRIPNDGAMRAGKAFVAMANRDPQARRATRLAMGAVRAKGEHYKELAAAFAARMAEVGRELSPHFTPPTTIEEWEELARIVEMSFETVESGEWKPSQVHKWALAWVKRQKIKSGLTAGQSGRGCGNSTVFTLTVQECADDAKVDKSVISQACTSGEIECRGEGKGKNGRRISADSFYKWKQQRAKLSQPAKADAKRRSAPVSATDAEEREAKHKYPDLSPAEAVRRYKIDRDRGH